MIAHNVLNSARLIGDVCNSFTRKCVKGIEANESMIKEQLEAPSSLIKEIEIPQRMTSIKNPTLKRQSNLLKSMSHYFVLPNRVKKQRREIMDSGLRQIW